MNSRQGAIALLVGAIGCGARAPEVRSGGAKSPHLAPRVVAGNLDASVLLGDLPARASQLGAGPLSVVASGEAVERERLGGFVLVPDGACLLGYARASTSIDDLDLTAFTDAGNPIASDDGPDAHPTLLLCPPHPERVYLAALTASGEGLVAVAAQLVGPERAAEVGRALGARGARFAAPRAADRWIGLDDHVRAHRDSLGGKWEEFRRVALAVDARVPAFLNFPLEAGACTDAVIVPDDDVALLEVEAVDEGGHVVARALGGARDRTVTVCSTLASGGSLLVRPHVGQGLAAVVLSRARGEVAGDLTARPDVAWAAGSLPLEATKSARNMELAKVGYPPPEVTRTGTLTTGRLFTVPIDLGAADGCSRLDLVSGAPLARVQAAVWDDKGVLVTQGEGAASVTLFACGHGKARLELEARGRGGPYALLMRPERWKDPAFAGHPLSTSHMLARAAVGTSAMLEGVPVAVRAAVVDAVHRLSWEETIPARKCLQIAVGAEGDGTGLSGRMIESTTGDEIDRTHADRAIAMRACATPEVPRVVRVEIHASAGKLDALIGERVTD